MPRMMAEREVLAGATEIKWEGRALGRGTLVLWVEEPSSSDVPDARSAVILPLLESYFVCVCGGG